jgi:hypothetical protein
MGADIAATALAESFRARKSDVMSDLEKKRKKKRKNNSTDGMPPANGIVYRIPFMNQVGKQLLSKLLCCKRCAQHVRATLLNVTQYALYNSELVHYFEIFFFELSRVKRKESDHFLSKRILRYQ